MKDGSGDKPGRWRALETQIREDVKEETHCINRIESGISRSSGFCTEEVIDKLLLLLSTGNIIFLWIALLCRF